MPLTLRFKRAIAYPALWLSREDYCALSEISLAEHLEAIADELVRDCGGFAAMVESVEWNGAARGTVERERVRAATLAALRHHDGNLARAAADLGIDPSTVWRRLKRWGLTPEACAAPGFKEAAL